MAKTVGGVETRYTLDPAAGLTQVLVEATGGEATSYVYGVDLLAQYDSGTRAYVLPDHLGSVRTETDALGQVTVVRHFDPFGVPLQADGGSPFGYTGEWWDADAALLYLRARWYEPGTGRFTQRDSWEGDIQQPQTVLRGYIYVGNNPLNVKDPTGLFPSPEFPWPWKWPAGMVVDLVKGSYCKIGLFRFCFFNPDNGQWPSDTVDDLFTDFVCEYGPEHRRFYANAHLTQQLARSYTVHMLRWRFYLQESGKCQVGSVR